MEVTRTVIESPLQFQFTLKVTQDEYTAILVALEKYSTYIEMHSPISMGCHLQTHLYKRLKEKYSAI